MKVKLIFLKKRITWKVAMQPLSIVCQVKALVAVNNHAPEASQAEKIFLSVRRRSGLA